MEMVDLSKNTTRKSFQMKTGNVPLKLLRANVQTDSLDNYEN